MTLETTTNVIVYRGNGATVDWDFNFRVDAATDLTVFSRLFTTKVLQTVYTSADFSLVGLGAATGGTLTLNETLADTHELVIARVVPLKQELDINDQGGYNPEPVEAQLDDMVMQIQQLNEQFNRSVRVPLGESLADIPAEGTRASKYLGFGAAGQLVLLSATSYTAVGASGSILNIVDDFGADPTGVASSLAAFNAAISFLNLNSVGTDLSDIEGISVFVPDGVYVIDGNLDPISACGVTFIGQSVTGTVLELSGAGSAFTWNSAAREGGLENMTLRYNAAPAATAIIVTLNGNAGNQRFKNLLVVNANTVAVLGTGAGSASNVSLWENVQGYVYNSGQPTFDLRWGVGLYLTDVDFYVDGVAVPANDRVSTMTTVANTNFINMTNGGWDTLRLQGVSSNRYYNGVYINAPGSIMNNIWLGDCILDYCSNDCVALHSPTNIAGAVLNVFIGAAYLFAWSGMCINITGDNYNGSHRFLGTGIVCAGTHGIHIEGAVTRDITIEGCTIIHPNRIVGNYAGIDFAEGLHVNMTNNRVLTNPVSGFAWGPEYGIQVAADLNYWTLIGNEAEGVTLNYNIAADATQSGLRICRNNFGANYSGFKTAAPYQIPASGVAWVNKSPFEVEVSFIGIDGGIVVTDVFSNTATYDSTSVSAYPDVMGSFIMQPGESLTPTFTEPIDAAETKMFFKVLA